MTIALSATGHGAMECTITNACERGETILIACNGIWGNRATDMAKRAGPGSPNRPTALRRGVCVYGLYDDP